MKYSSGSDLYSRFVGTVGVPDDNLWQHTYTDKQTIPKKAFTSRNWIFWERGYFFSHSHAVNPAVYGRTSLNPYPLGARRSLWNIESYQGPLAGFECKMKIWCPKKSRVMKGMWYQGHGLKEVRLYLILPIQIPVIIPKLVGQGLDKLYSVYTPKYTIIHPSWQWNFRAQFGHRNRSVSTVITDGLSPCQWSSKPHDRSIVILMQETYLRLIWRWCPMTPMPFTFCKRLWEDDTSFF